MMMKHRKVIMPGAVLAVGLSIAGIAFAGTKQSPEEELAALLHVDESQYHLQTRGQARLIVPGDPLLDGNYKNGELVNGSVYHSVEEALAGVKRDKIEAKIICEELTASAEETAAE